MNGENVSNEQINEQPKPCWFIDLGWYQQNSRSLSTLAKNYLCAKCCKRLNAEEKEVPAAKLISTIKGCCASDPQFITDKLPILESIFRLFIANGNQPMDLEELSKQLSERRGGDTYHTSVEILSRLLKNEGYYGLRQVPD